LVRRVRRMRPLSVGGRVESAFHPAIAHYAGSGFESFPHKAGQRLSPLAVRVNTQSRARPSDRSRLLPCADGFANVSNRPIADRQGEEKISVFRPFGSCLISPRQHGSIACRRIRVLNPPGISVETVGNPSHLPGRRLKSTQGSRIPVTGIGFGCAVAPNGDPIKVGSPQGRQPTRKLTGLTRCFSAAQ
jgi:hypothetical protein